MTDTEPLGLSGRRAAERLLAEAKREEFVAIELLARALRSTRRRVERDWRGRGLPVTRLGHAKLLASKLVVETYFPHVQAKTATGVDCAP